ncbi:MAG: dihydroneopterin triphosphate diphosphatase [Gammaproteobacteria bacterium]|nr:dihydroneopterin triphosphate diphosphatase [Gammaproteobacteria bacterium]
MSASGHKRPESVLVVVHTSDRLCLMLERTQPRGFWQSVTGSLRWKETAADAAAREVREETGLDPVDLVDARDERRFVIAPEWRHRYAADVNENIEHWFYLELPGVCEVTLSPAEHCRYEWLDLDAAIERATSWTNREAIEALRSP